MEYCTTCQNNLADTDEYYCTEECYCDYLNEEIEYLQYKIEQLDVKVKSLPEEKE